MNYPLVSICIPTYNRASLLKEAIASAIVVDYPNIEIVISDNASTDNTCEVVQAFNDERIKYYRNETNIGSYRNFRKVLYEHAKGAYAIYLADDDLIIDKFYIRQAIDLIIKNKKIVLVLSNWRYIKNNQEVNITFSLENIFSGEKLVAEYYPKKLYDSLPYHLMLYTVLFDRNLSVRIDAMFPECLNFDVIFMLKIASCGDVGFINSISAGQRYTGNNFSSICPYDYQLESMFKIGNELERHLKETGMSKRIPIKKIKMRAAKRERNAVFGKMLLEINRKKAQFFPSFLAFLVKLYKENPLLLLIFLNPIIIVQLLLVNFNFYLFLKKKFGRKYYKFLATNLGRDK